MFDGRNHRDIIKMRFGRDTSVCAEISAVPCHAVLSCTHVEVYLSLIISQCWYDCLWDNQASKISCTLWSCPLDFH